jgi:hypothetical protein
MVGYLAHIPLLDFQAAEYGYENATHICLDAVLSINRRYFRFVVPRIKYFQENYPDVTTLAQLKNLIQKFGYNGFAAVWNYKHPSRVETLECLVNKYIKYNGANSFSEDLAGMRHWANYANVLDYMHFGVKGIGLATFQYLRMLLGVPTVKPDVHIKRAVSEALHRKVTDLEAISIVEQASKEIGLSATIVDHSLWRVFASDSDGS